MSFDPRTVLLNIRNRKNQQKPTAQDSVLSHNEASVSDKDRIRDEQTSQSVIHVMSDQIRYMQDHIRRLESQLAEAHLEISRLKAAKEAVPAVEIRRDPSVGSVSINRSKRSDASIPAQTKPSPLIKKASVSQANIASSSFENLPKPANSHHKSTSAITPQTNHGYLGLYVSGRSKDGSEHGSNQPQQFSSKSHHYNSKTDLRMPSIKEANDLRLDILEKILSLEENSSVPHLSITFV